MGSLPMIAWQSWFHRGVRALLPSARSLRMSAYASFAFGGLALASARSVHADVGEMGLGMGHQLAKLEDLTSGAYLIHVNGAELHRASGHTQQSAAQVMDRYEAYCRERPGALGQAMLDIPSALADRIELPKGAAARVAVMRNEADGRGMVACFVDDPHAPAVPLVDRMRALAETSDLSKLGHFRYVFAEPSTGPVGGTHVVTFWSDGELNLKKMFPASGDAPGSDSPIAPRPAGSRRTMSASVDGYPASVRIYESLASRDSVERMYDQALSAKGFTKIAPAGSSSSGAAYVREDNAEIIVSITATGGRTSVTIVEALASPTQGVHVEVK